MKLLILVLILLCPFESLCSASKIERESEYWEKASEFNYSLDSYDSARLAIHELESLEKGLDDKLIRQDLILKTLHFHQLYSNTSLLENTYGIALKEVSRKNVEYLQLLTNYVLLLELSGKSDKAKVVYHRLGNVNSRPAKLYLIALDLYLKPTSDNYNKLEKDCLNLCNFALYHLAKMNYFKVNEKYAELEEYSKGLLNSLIEGSTYVNSFFFPKYVMAYLSFSLKSNHELSKYFYSIATENVNSGTFVYMKVMKASH